MRRIHSNWKECRLVAGRERRLWYLKHGYTQTQHINRCSYGHPFVNEQQLGYSLKYFWRVFRKPHPSVSSGHSHSGYVGYSRRQGNPQVWSASWMRPRKKRPIYKYKFKGWVAFVAA